MLRRVRVFTAKADRETRSANSIVKSLTQTSMDPTQSQCRATWRVAPTRDVNAPSNCGTGRDCSATRLFQDYISPGSGYKSQVKAVPCAPAYVQRTRSTQATYALETVFIVSAFTNLQRPETQAVGQLNPRKACTSSTSVSGKSNSETILNLTKVFKLLVHRL